MLGGTLGNCRFGKDLLIAAFNWSSSNTRYATDNGNDNDKNDYFIEKIGLKNCTVVVYDSGIRVFRHSPVTRHFFFGK